MRLLEKAAGEAYVASATKRQAEYQRARCSGTVGVAPERLLKDIVTVPFAATGCGGSGSW